MVEVLPLPKICPVRSFAERRLLERIAGSVQAALDLRDYNVRQPIVWSALPFNQDKWFKSDCFAARQQGYICHRQPN